MNKMVSFVLVAILAGCSAEGPTAPTPVTETASTPPVVAANPAPVALVPVPPGVRLNFYNNAAFEVFNDTADVLVVTSYITSFDDQVTPLEPKRSEPVQPGQSLNTSYNRGCVQLDVDQIGFAFYDQDGKQVDRITQAIRDACAPVPTCVPDYSQSYYTGEFVIDYLSNTGNGYQLLDDGELWQTHNLTAGYNLTPTYPHAVDGSVLLLRWPSGTTPTKYTYTMGTASSHAENACKAKAGFSQWTNAGSGQSICTLTVAAVLTDGRWSYANGNSTKYAAYTSTIPGVPTYENIGSATASCPDLPTEVGEDEITAAWHGTVSFKCTLHKVNSCERR